MYLPFSSFDFHAHSSSINISKTYTIFQMFRLFKEYSHCTCIEGQQRSACALRHSALLYILPMTLNNVSISIGFRCSYRRPVNTPRLPEMHSALIARIGIDFASHFHKTESDGQHHTRSDRHLNIH